MRQIFSGPGAVSKERLKKKKLWGYRKHNWNVCLTLYLDSFEEICKYRYVSGKLCQWAWEKDSKIVKVEIAYSLMMKIVTCLFPDRRLYTYLFNVNFSIWSGLQQGPVAVCYHVSFAFIC